MATHRGKHRYADRWQTYVYMCVPLYNPKNDTSRLGWLWQCYVGFCRFFEKEKFRANHKDIEIKKTYTQTGDANKPQDKDLSLRKYAQEYKNKND